MKAKLIFAALALTASSAFAQVQTEVGVPPTLDVQRLAPQLVAFAGGEVNFSNLVNGLALGLPVTLTTPLGTLTATQIAQTLETARQALISLGIANPTAQQIGVALLGGSLPTATGTAQTTALVASTTVLGATNVPTSTSASPAGATSASTLRHTSDSPFPRGVSDTPQTIVPGVVSPSAPPAASLPFDTATTPRVNSPFVNGATPAGGGTAAPFAR